MVSLEQVKLLESKVIKAIEYVDQVTEENSILREKLESYQKRVDELEVLVQRFKEDQSRIEEGIISALNRLSQFEADMKRSLSPEKFRKDAVPGKAVQKEVEIPSEQLEEQNGGDEPVKLSYESSLVKVEEETDSGLILEPETDDLPGDEENSEETLNPGELDIF
ncbi:MAG: cell division protein ZapB [Treponema sp.]|jgi:chromosome segregation ATPase|nr:cell division protein ZapB [Treponema sp.]